MAETALDHTLFGQARQVVVPQPDLRVDFPVVRRQVGGEFARARLAGVVQVIRQAIAIETGEERSTNAAGEELFMVDVKGEPHRVAKREAKITAVVGGSGAATVGGMLAKRMRSPRSLLGPKRLRAGHVP